MRSWTVLRRIICGAWLREVRLSMIKSYMDLLESTPHAWVRRSTASLPRQSSTFEGLSSFASVEADAGGSPEALKSYFGQGK